MGRLQCAASREEVLSSASSFRWTQPKRIRPIRKRGAACCSLVAGGFPVMAVKDKSGESSLKLSYEVRNFSDSGFRSETISGLDRKSTRLNSSHLGISYA